MRSSSHLLIVALLALITNSCGPSGSDSGKVRGADSPAAEGPQSISARFESIANDALSSGRIEGLQFALVESGETLSVRAFGLADREQNVAMTVDTLINVASISKSLTAWGVLAFLERERIELDTSARDLMIKRDLYDEVFSGADVSIRMLLSHTSGLSGASVPVTPASEALPEIDDVLLGRSSVPRARMQRAPGSGYAYSGAGYLVLQQILEDRTERSFANYMKETILVPAGMVNSDFSLLPDMLTRVAAYYRADGRRREPYHLPGAAGGLYSTARDMARFLALYSERDKEAREGIISDEGYAALLRPQVSTMETDGRIPVVHYALGHYTYATPEGVRIVLHPGGNPGLRAIFVVALERDAGFFAVANSDNGSEVLAEMMRAWGEHYGVTLHHYF